MKERVQELQNRLPQGIDAVLITSPINRFYYAGFRSTAGTLFITKNSSTFFIDFRYIEAAEATVKGSEVILQENIRTQLNDIIKKEHIKTIGTETSYMSMEEFGNFQKMLDAELLFDERVNTLILEQRRYKSQQEIEYIKQAQAISEQAFEKILGMVKVGVTERAIALELEFETKRLGSERNAFDYIVNSGVRTSMPHGVPTDKKIEAGDFVTIDFGSVVCGYHSDMTRTFAVGFASDEMKAAYDVTLRAQQAAIDTIKAGVKCCEIDKAARDIIYAAGYQGCFGHGLGHSFGLQIHENPRYNEICDQPTEVGHVMSVEPGIYMKNKFGLRIEDIVAVTETGCINLTKTPKKLLIL